MKTPNKAVNNNYSNDDLNKEIYRICFLGSSSTGKTMIINKLVNNSFYEHYEPTYDVDYYRTEFSVINNEVFNKNNKSTVEDKVTLILEDS